MKVTFFGHNCYVLQGSQRLSYLYSSEQTVYHYFYLYRLLNIHSIMRRQNTVFIPGTLCMLVCNLYHDGKRTAYQMTKYKRGLLFKSTVNNIPVRTGLNMVYWIIKKKENDDGMNDDGMNDDDQRNRKIGGNSVTNQFCLFITIFLDKYHFFNHFVQFENEF